MQGNSPIVSLTFRHASRKAVFGDVDGVWLMNEPFSFSSIVFPTSCLRNEFSCLSHDGVVGSLYLDPPVVKPFNKSQRG